MRKVCENFYIEIREGKNFLSWFLLAFPGFSLHPFSSAQLLCRENELGHCKLESTS